MWFTFRPEIRSAQDNGLLRLRTIIRAKLLLHCPCAGTSAIAQRMGRFELANQGTIFLDEIGEIPLELQPELLRVLQEREFERLGSSKTLKTNTRLIAATNRDLGALAREQKFRSDLFYRLNVFPLHVPALRERSEDIPLLVQHFVQCFSKRMNRNMRKHSQARHGCSCEVQLAGKHPGAGERDRACYDHECWSRVASPS
jgi:transcriptional regulator with GAF, ATPase, and Fis domain